MEGLPSTTYGGARCGLPELFAGPRPHPQRADWPFEPVTISLQRPEVKKATPPCECGAEPCET